MCFECHIVSQRYCIFACLIIANFNSTRIQVFGRQWAHINLFFVLQSLEQGPQGWQQQSTKPDARVLWAYESTSDRFRYLLAENVFETIDIFEQRESVGGVWNLSSAEWSTKIPIPQIDPRYGSTGDPLLDDPKTGHVYQLVGKNKLEFESPLYDYLETNIPKQLMAYSDQPFHDDLPLFPGHEAVLEYLEVYADEIRHLIHFHTQVVRVKLVETHRSDLWEVTTENLDTGQSLTSTYDAVVVANGHYTIPCVPDIFGVHTWNEINPGIITHSKAYRRPEDFTDKKVIVIGNSASGTDIATQIARYCRHPLLLSSRTSNEFFPTRDPSSQVEEVPEIIEFLSPETAERAVKFQDGRVECAIDAVIFATGYFYHFPFLELASSVITDGFRTHDVYQHIFHIEHPSLAFPVLNLKIIPFPLAENQAAVIARVWAGRLSLPEKQEMRAWEGRRLAERGEGRAFHVLKFPEDAEVLNGLFEWAKAARGVKGMQNDGAGKLGVHWDARSVWMRARLRAIKKAFAEKQDEKFVARRAEELGFDYEKLTSFESSILVVG